MAETKRIPEYHEVPPDDPTKATTYLPDAGADEAYNQGCWAYGFGFEDDANPYPEGHPARSSWWQGWSDGAADCGG